MSPHDSRHRAPVSVEHLITVARELVQVKGLGDWTMRDLEERAQVSPSSIYHRLGSREAICERVVESITDDMGVNQELTGWKEFLRDCCSRLFDTLTPYPGTAAWLMAHGPVQPASLAAMSSGIKRLEAAGIHPAGLAYSLIINHALGVIASAEDRRRRGGGDHARIVQRVQEGDTSGGVAAAAMGAFLGAFVVDRPQDLHAVRRDYFSAAIDTTLAGVEHGFLDGTVRGAQRFAPAASDA